LILTAILLAGCARPTMIYERDPDGDVRAIDNASLTRVLTNWFPNAHVLVVDDKYVLVNVKWFAEEFEPYIESLGMVELAAHASDPQGPLSDGQFDCEDFSARVYAEARACHLEAGTMIDAPLVGEVYSREPGKRVGHALNFVVVIDWENERVGMMFYDATVGEVVVVDPETVVFVKM
jgi:hypothetical protein